MLVSERNISPFSLCWMLVRMPRDFLCLHKWREREREKRCWTWLAGSWGWVGWEQWQPSMVRRACISIWETSATPLANGISMAMTNQTATMDFRYTHISLESSWSFFFVPLHFYSSRHAWRGWLLLCSGSDWMSLFESLSKLLGGRLACLLGSRALNALLVCDEFWNQSQSKFFETFGGVFSKRGLLLKFLVLGWATSIGYFGSTAAGDLLPIKKGPQQPPVIGPRDRI